MSQRFPQEKNSLKKIAVPPNFYNNRPMKENTDSKILNTDMVYSLDVRIPDQLPKRIEIIDRVLAGIDPRNDLILIDPKVLAKHFLFRLRNNILTVQFLGKDAETFLNGLPLENGKLYILEKGDILKVGTIEIIIRRDTNIIKASGPSNTPAPRKVNLEKLAKISELSELDALSEISNEQERKKDQQEGKGEDLTDPNFVFNEMPVQNRPKPKKKEPILDFSTIRLIPYKFYGFVVDVTFTYFILSFIVPTLGLLPLAQEFLYPISGYLSDLLAENQISLPILSILEFLVCFHSLMIITSMILGTSPGAFLIGLLPYGDKNFLITRFKGYIYALLNVLVLPLLVFDIPFYRGKNLKELLTFSKREISDSIIFKTLRRAIIPIALIAAYISPFFLPPPYTAEVSLLTNRASKFIEAHSTSLSSHSKDLGISLDFDLFNEYAILPLFEKNKFGMVLYDLKNKKSVLLQEQNRFSNNLMLHSLRYANPLSSQRIPDNLISSEQLKKKSLVSMELSLSNVASGLLEFGPFFANGFLFKEQFLKNFGTEANFLMNSFGPKNPVLKISAGKMEKFFWFCQIEVIEFNLIGSSKTKLYEDFTNGLIKGMKFYEAGKSDPKTPQILEVLEAFELSRPQVILTYYMNEAKRWKDTDNPEWRTFFLKNLEQTKKALLDQKKRGSKNIETSFNEIIAVINKTE